MSTNFGAAAEDYAKFRAGFPESLFDRLTHFGIGRVGSDIVDVGTGTGSMARGFARRGAKVIGIDPDERLMAQARGLDASAGVVVLYRAGRAEQLPLPDRSADVIAAGQSWHWFDGSRAASEFARVVRPGGRAVVAYFDWLPVAGNVVEATEKLIEQHNPRWRLGGGNGFHPECIAPLSAAGFRGFESFSYDLDIPYTPEAWRGRIRASAGVGAALRSDEIRTFDIALARLLEESFPAPVLPIPHRVFAVIATAAESPG